MSVPSPAHRAAAEICDVPSGTPVKSEPPQSSSSPHEPTQNSDRAFGVDPVGGARFNVTKLGPILEAIHERLAGVVIECLPYGTFIERYDRPGTLFYLDPPYWGTEDYYGKNLFERDDYIRLAEQLGGIKGRFILSLNDTPGVRDVFSAFDMDGTSVIYTVRQDRPKRAHELIITGP